MSFLCKTKFVQIRRNRLHLAVIVLINKMEYITREQVCLSPLKLSFLPRGVIDKRSTCCRKFVCPSVGPFVTLLMQ